jgi:hypothetical protein
MSVDPVSIAVAVAAAIASSGLSGDMSESLSNSWRELRALVRRRFGLRTLVLQALELDAKDHGQSMEYPSGTASTSPDDLDALLPEGLGDLPGPLGVELWFPVAGAGSAASLVERLERSSARLASQRELAGLLFIRGAAIDDSDVQGVDDYLAGRKDAAPIHMWGPEEMTALFERHRAEIGALLPELAIAPLRADLQGPESDWRSQSAARLERLAAIYRGEGVVMALGAGVSIGMGVPNWDELVGALLVSLVTKQLTDSVDEQQAIELADAVRKVGNESPLLSARYLRRGFEDGNAGDPRAFQQALAAVLYGRGNGGGTPSPLLKELAKLCMPQRTGPKVHSVITYNFDDLLEQVLVSEGIGYRSIYSVRHRPLETELPVYHVHGFLPRDAEKFDRLEEGLLAFSEEGYHQLFRDPYHWTNVIQLQAFQQHICILVGLSLTDPNLRRLLEYAATSRDEPRHFAFMKRTSAEDLLAASGKGPDGEAAVKPEAARDFLRVHHSLQEHVYAELGLEVIWFDSYQEMPEAVAALRT